MLFDFGGVSFLTSHQLNALCIVLLSYGSYIGLMKFTFCGHGVTDEDIEKSREQDIMKRVFPTLSPVVKERFMLYKISCQRFDIFFFLRVTVGSIFYFTRCNAFHGLYDGPYFESSVIVGIITWNALIFFFIALGIEMLLKKASSHSINAASLLKWASYIQKSIGTGLFEEMSAIGCQISFGLSLYGRIMAGPCPEGTSWLDTARCNPSANIRFLPMDHLMFMTITPVLAPLTLRNIRLEAAVLMWFVQLGFVLLSMDHVDAGNSITRTRP